VKRRRVAILAALVLTPMVGAAVAFDGWVDSFVTAKRARRGPRASAPPEGVDHVLRIEVDPAAELDVWVLDPDDAPRGTVFVLHGVHSDKRPMIDYGRRLARGGLRAVLVDLRGHGASTGRTLTYGVYDGADLVAVMDDLQRRDLLAAPVGVHGPSYGGAVALGAAALDARIERVVTVSTFSSAGALAGSYLDLLGSGLGAWLPDAIGDALVNEGSRRTGVDLWRSNSVNAIQATAAPVLLFHGDRDRLVPFRQGQLLASACGARCELVRLSGLDHDGALGAPQVGPRAAGFFLAR